MTVTLPTQTQYTQASNKTTATKATSEYQSATSTQVSSDNTNAANENSAVDKFLEEVYSKSSITSASAITKDNIQNKVNEYAQTLMKNQTDTSESKLENSKEVSALEKLLATKEVVATDGVTSTQATSATDNVSKTEATDKMAQMQEKYKDVYTPMPEKFSQEIEDLQTSLIREKYPDYLPFDEVLKKYAVAVENPSPEAIEKAKIAQDAKIAESLKTEGPNYYNGGLPRDEEREAFINSVMKQHPNNIEDKYFDLSNAPQRAKTLNAAVYEGLEKGESLDNAYAKATQVMNTCIDNTEMFQKMFDRSRNFFKEQYAQFEKWAEEGKKIMQRDGILQIQKDDNSIIYDGTVLDLREFGFDRDMSTLELFKNNNNMVTSIQNQMKYLDFILNNQDIVKGKYEELNEKYKQQNSFNDTVITPAKETLPIAQRALDVFSKYTIF